ncbi:hypothetical protein E3T39_04610 [Cryobacterium suzukii]|uniref:Hemagglutinin n=1 Tax=Cryobacterium suzukii TaxID=1259198 RepID=A0A4R9AG41_9MICO|nr:hypothetical protein [Cryobacterium suzukii]TFD61354.1 hypothetical protein E3T39_04610 [Cryobacterium suzukii]
MKIKWMRVLALGLVLGSLGAFIVAAPQRAEALSGSDFNPGNIISDQNFFTTDAMSQNEIQAFLNAQVGTCSNTLCLNVYSMNTATTTLAFGTCATYVGEANESAARIIYKVQQACSVSAKILLVTLQKEQGLVTSKGPTEAILRKALGQGCPDGSSCDPAFYGFFLQVYSAARQFAWYGNPAGSHTSIKVGQTNAVRFHPNTACGSSNVVIQNRATAALYYYTPYQPNQAALANLGGTGDACSSYGNRNFWIQYSDWFGSPTAGKSPVGNVELISGRIGGVQVAGWALDPDTTSPIDVHVYVDGAGRSIQANLSRSDVGAHGYNVTIPVTFPGIHSVCVYGINTLGGTNTQYACSTVVTPGGSPIGGVEAVSGVDGGVAVSGWAIDPDTAQPIDVHVYVSGAAVGYRANKIRTDVGRAYPEYGNNHGFSEKITATPGVHDVCVYAINTSSGANALFGCTSVTVPGNSSITEQGRTPIGAFEAAQGVTGGINVGGWALDPDTASSIAVHIYVDGTGVPYQANKLRTDVGAAFPPYGNNHGFGETIAVTPGNHQVCVYAINTGPGTHAMLGCSAVTVPGAVGITERGRAPVGVIEAAQGGSGGVNVSGWALDPDTAASIEVHVYVDGAGSSYTANKARTDIASAFPGYGASHGFSETVSAPPGAHETCVYAINTGSGVNSLLGCHTVTVPGSVGITEQGRTPIGVLEAVHAVSGGVSVGGWALDPDTAAAITVHIYVDGVGVPYSANKSRTDIAAAFPGYGENHGFGETVSVAQGSHQVCVYAINSGAGAHASLGCSTVTVS